MFAIKFPVPIGLPSCRAFAGKWHDGSVEGIGQEDPDSVVAGARSARICCWAVLSRSQVLSGPTSPFCDSGIKFSGPAWLKGSGRSCRHRAQILLILDDLVDLIRGAVWTTEFVESTLGLEQSH